MFNRSLVIFRRDLRVYDNTALAKAVKNSSEVVCCFIFDPIQVGGNNAYRGLPALQFLLESLDDLQLQLDGKLHVMYGGSDEVVSDMIATHRIDAVFVNEDCTPFSKKRDESISLVCRKNDVSFVSCHDLFLTRPGSVRNGQGLPYKVFTPFKRAAMQKQVPRPVSVDTSKCVSLGINNWDYWGLISTKRELFALGGRSNALSIFDSISDFVNYDDERNYPSLDKTTGLSAYHKFGCVSVRETYHVVGDTLGYDHTIISELYWRDFFSSVVVDFPEVFGSEFQEKYRTLKWNQESELFAAWCEGRTGYPLVDAGMRELNETGYMHNRVRMVVASFLCKDLRIDWRLGEKYFAQHLIDYDPAVNNGNWQWAASTGCDAQPYFRIFNPVSQQKRFDVNCEYIKKWVPELRSLDAKQIHKLVDSPSSLVEYPRPIVDHKEQREITLAWFKEI